MALFAAAAALFELERRGPQAKYAKRFESQKVIIMIMRAQRTTQETLEINPQSITYYFSNLM